MSYDKTKCDPDLGIRVHEHLKKLGLETPYKTVPMNRQEKINSIQNSFQNIMEVLGLDLTDDSLINSPKRVAKMFVEEIFWGLYPESFPKCTTISNKMKYDEMVIEKGINVQSFCEHHFVSINGKATIAYIPKNEVMGLSKLNRVTEYFSRRPQVQERLTEQIYHALSFILKTNDIAVYIDAEHLCVKSRGVEDTGSSTITTKLGGAFKDKTMPEVRNEFMGVVNSRN